MTNDKSNDLGASALKGLAHPVRLRLLELLDHHGPATATQLAAQTGENTGSTSYHLRILARHGLIEDVPERGKGKERWWRSRATASTVTGSAATRRPLTPPSSCSRT
ncbi:ArsR/SmtB family transcription factor [Streptosporangium lutulentum]